MGKGSIHLVGNAHLDPAWLWPVAEGLAEARATFGSALDRMGETAGFEFTASAAALYRWIEGTDPALFKRIQEAVRAGRWTIPGGWHTQSDCNLPAGESFARNALYSQRWVREKFGVTATVGYCVDSFGHCGSLPQLLKLGGMDSYVFMRPMQPEAPDVPKGAFVWEGTDGTRVLCYHLENYLSLSREHIVYNADRVREHAVPVGMVFYGVGDHGGGPTKALIREVEKLRGESGEYAYSNPNRFFDELAGRKGELEVFRGELQHHAIGCYAALAAMKKANRRAVWGLLAAERIAAMAGVVAGAPGVEKKIESAWLDVLFSDFHDIAGGSCERSACETAMQQLARAQFSAGEMLAQAMQQISAGIDTTPPREGVHTLVVFNPHAFKVTGLMDSGETFFHPCYNDPGRFALLDEKGRAVEFQQVVTSGRAHTLRFVFPIEMEAMSWRVFHVDLPAKDQSTPMIWHAKLPKGAEAGGLRASEAGLENEHVKVSVDGGGGMTMWDKKLGWEVFKAPAGLPVVMEDASDTWSHGLVKFEGAEGRFGLLSREVMESGSLRAALRLRFGFGRSTLMLDYVLERGAWAVKMKAVLDWRERQRLLKFAFPVNVEKGVWRSEIPYGVEAREMDGEEYPMQTWTDISGAGRGVAIANDCKYSVDVREGVIRITALRSPAYAHCDPLKPLPDDIFQDQGIHEFEFWVLPHGEEAMAEVGKAAQVLNLPLCATWEGRHGGDRPAVSGSFIAVDSAAVTVSVIKRAEEGEALVVRAVEIGNVGGAARFAMAGLKRTWVAKFRAGEIKTFRVPLTGGEVREVNFLEEAATGGGRI